MNNKHEVRWKQDCNFFAFNADFKHEALTVLCATLDRVRYPYKAKNFLELYEAGCFGGNAADELITMLFVCLDW